MLSGTPGRVRVSVRWSDCLSLSVFKGPTAPYLRDSRSHFLTFFSHFFRSAFFSNPGLQNGAPGSSQNHQNLQKSLPGGLPKSTLEKDLEKASILSPSGLQKCLIFIVGVIKNKKSRVPEKAPKMTSKCLPKWSLGALQITQNQEKRALKKTLKNNTAKSGFVVAF